MGCPVTMRIHDTEPRPTVAQLLDVSLDGCAVRAAERLAPAMPIELDVTLCDVRMTLAGEVVDIRDVRTPMPTAVVRWTRNEPRLGPLLLAERRRREVWRPRRRVRQRY